METSFNEIICPINVEWKFNKADLLSLMDSKGGYLDGQYYYAFNIPGLQYYARIYPNGDDEDCCDQIWVFLNVNSSNGKRKIFADILMTVESADFSETLKDVFETSLEADIGCGEKLCKISEFFDSKNNYFVNGEITIKMNGFLKTEQSQISIVSCPISTQWKIKEQDLKKAILDGSNDVSLLSENVKVASFSSNVSYYLSLYPNETNDENQSSSSSETFIYFHLQFRKGRKIEAVFDFSIESANFNYGMQYSFEDSGDWGDFLCLTSELLDPSKRYIVDGFLTVNLQGILIIEKDKFVTLKLKNELAPKIDEKDFKIIVGDNEIEVHKQLLMDASPVLCGMFESGMKESIENKMFIEDFSFKIVNSAVSLFYNFNESFKFTFEDSLLLFQFADKYRIKSLMDLIEQSLIKIISPSNVCQLLKFSSPDSLNVTKLHQNCIKFLLQCSKESTPVYGSDSLDEKFLATMFLNTLRSIINTDTNN